MHKKIVISIPERWDKKNNEFISGLSYDLILEHSLVTISKWESKWHKPFLSSKDKTDEEVLDYIKCMTVNSKNIPDEAYNFLTPQNYEEIKAFISDTMTATTVYIRDQNNRGSREQITSELIYYWMISLGIPVEFEHWHLNRLLTLIKVCGVKNQGNEKGRKLSSSELSSRAALNAARRKQLNSTG